eukprot:SAG31_NODE_5398_length_2560_cov_2.708537_6_plen_42_part_01
MDSPHNSNFELFCLRNPKGLKSHSANSIDRTKQEQVPDSTVL